MGKLKTRKAAAKRFKVRKSGKVFRYQSKTKHLLEHKQKTVKNRLAKRIEVSAADKSRVKKMLGV